MAVQLQAPSLLRAPAGRPALRSAFCAAPLSVRMPVSGRAMSAAAARIRMRFGGVASKQAYICRDCGYIYKDRTPFEKLSDDYYCPVCAAPKRRFRPYEPPVAKNANATDARKARKEQLHDDIPLFCWPLTVCVAAVDSDLAFRTQHQHAEIWSRAN